MDTPGVVHYIPGEQSKRPAPLDRYLPPIHTSVASTWLSENLPKGSWVLDPFGTSPDLVREIAAQGYKVLVSINNPITRFILELSCNPPKKSEFKAAIAALAAIQVGKQRLEPHIKSLYETTCDACNQPVQVEAFVWQQDGEAPYARIFTCPYCNKSGEFPVTPQDIHTANRFQKHGLHRARALERVTPLHDPDRRHVEEALEVYLPRAIYVLITIINKISSMPQIEPHHRHLNALLLLAFDRANTLWLYPKERQRPKQLTIPPQYREHNIWQAIETAVDIWFSEDHTIPITRWPELPSTEGGICLYEGRARELATNLDSLDIQGIVTSFPRPNQAFWTLSALWSGWLWGHEALDQFKSVLRRRRYDWSWHTTAIQSTLKLIVPKLPEKVPIFGMINEVEPGFLSAVILGSQFADLSLVGIGMRVEDGQAQITWQNSQPKEAYIRNDSNIKHTILESTRTYLHQRGEPCPYTYLHTAGLTGLAAYSIPRNTYSPSDYLSAVHNSFQEALTEENGYQRFSGSEKSLDVGQWWRQDLSKKLTPLSDQIEIALFEQLVGKPEISFPEVDAHLCNLHPGLLTPGWRLIHECLESYGVREDIKSNRWSIHPREILEKRQNDLVEITRLIHQLGIQLDFKVKVEKEPLLSVYWIGTNQQHLYSFYLSTSAILGMYLNPGVVDGKQKFIVIPGSRSNLIAFKLQQNPYAQSFFDSNWQFIKYRLIRQLIDSTTLDIRNLDEMLALDPITYTTPQMRLF